MNRMLGRSDSAAHKAVSTPATKNDSTTRCVKPPRGKLLDMKILLDSTIGRFILAERYFGVNACP